MNSNNNQRHAVRRSHPSKKGVAWQVLQLGDAVELTGVVVLPREVTNG